MKAKISLKTIDPGAHPLCKDKEEAQQKTQEMQKQIYDLLYLMFADNKHSLLIILQGIDTSGKDGTVRQIFRCANPQGIKVVSFKKPTPEELHHDFLWRCHFHTPESGYTAIFNRSYYEEVTTVMVHPELLEDQHIPSEITRRPDFFTNRYKSINDFEKMLSRKGTVVIKFLLHISKEEQKKRIENRLQDRSKNWKFSTADVIERKHWNKYMSSFEKMVNATNTEYAPWVVVPADNKWYRDYVVTLNILGALKKIKMKFPKAK